MRIRPQMEADYPALVELLNAIYREAFSVEEYARQQSTRPADLPFTVLVAEIEGQLVGRGSAGATPQLPEGDMAISVAVALPVRRLGVASALLASLLAFCQPHRPARLRANLPDDSPEALSWAERRGFARKFHMLESRLDLTTYDPARLAGRVEVVQARGIRLVPFSAVRSKRNEARLWQFYQCLMKDTPDGADWRETPKDEWLDWAFRESAAWPEGWLIAIAPGGDWAGLTFMQKYTDGSGAHIFMTGVRPEYRGQGIATALKLEGARVAKEHGLTSLSTINEEENRPILAANQRIGFARVSGFYRLVRPFVEEA